MSADTTFFSIVSFITFILVAIPFPWHLEAWNTGTCLYMAWTSLGCLNLFINSVIWRGNMVNWAPVWCDISTKLMCINRRLYHIAIIRTVTTTKSDKRRAVITDLSIGLGLPVLFMILQYVVQGHRFDIFEDYGCMTFTYNTPVAYLIVQTPVLVLGLISTVYAVLSIMAFKRRTIELQVLLSSSSGPSPNRYLRLMCLAGIEILLSMPIALIGIAISAQGDVEPWISWEDTHFDFSRVDQYPAALFALEQARWVVVFFGFAEEARRHYRVMYMAVTRRLGVNVGEDEASMGSKKTEVRIELIDQK
ncbi:pheromone receptor [Lyophyllum atratum]|nr:pheromone receptor [Lyophyllum atratum]